ncbi:MAG: hypothetical protein LBJ91_04440 [Clostridiales Family XIII bacterium]|nr:hypothetical protein [Clostridiales Family XIII bacterium]
MILVIFGLIAVGAALLLIYYSRKPGSGGFSGVTRARRVQATVVPERHYKKSKDGKVVYLFDDDDDDEDSETPEDKGPGGPGEGEGKE